MTVRYGASDEVMRHHLAQHVQDCPNGGQMGSQRACPHGTVIAFVCECGDPLFLIESPTSTCHCRLVEVGP